jgi:hypothetical protein
MQTHFYSTAIGYWVAIGEVSPEQLAAYPEDTTQVPERPHDWSNWDPENSVWVEDTEKRDALRAAAIRAEVQHRLTTEVDPIVTNPLRFGELTEEERTALSDYRRALLDITGQPTFPESVEWPTRPGDSNG